MSSEAAVTLLRIQCRAQQREATSFCQLTYAPLKECTLAGDRRGFAGEEWQLGRTNAGVQCPLSAFAGIMKSYRSSGENVCKHTHQQKSGPKDVTRCCMSCPDMLGGFTTEDRKRRIFLLAVLSSVHENWHLSRILWWLL